MEKNSVSENLQFGVLSLSQEKNEAPEVEGYKEDI